MGCVMSAEEIPRPQPQQREPTFMEEGPQVSKYINLFLVGTGGPVKSTILKQMKFCADNGFKAENFKWYHPQICFSAINSLAVLLRAMRNLEVKFGNEEREYNVKLMIDIIHRMEDPQPFPQELFDAMKRLWEDKGVQKSFEKYSEDQLNDFLDRFGRSDYHLTKKDILHILAKAAGIVEVTFSLKQLNCRLIDVSGLRYEMRKWAHYFQDVSAIIFCVSLTEYDQLSYENETTNRMQESLQLFEEICNNVCFKDSPIILFLDKMDDLKDKIKESPLTICFPNYVGALECGEAAAFIQAQFERKRATANRTALFDIVSDVFLVNNIRVRESYDRYS